MRYTVQINLDEANLFGRMSEIDEWLQGRGLSPEVRQTSDDVTTSVLAAGFSRLR